ncbi:MAG TPA: SGNH/GDSL hydrolase family protein [Candidatus Hydrogenedentes bacterium]|nr:SGNH/GDSL hydrolase family protein [Candidatus Hydrogenedentota bacterium]
MTDASEKLADRASERENPPPKHRIRDAVFSILWIACATLFLLGVLEGIARFHEIWNPPMRVDLGQGFDESVRLFIPDPEDRRFMRVNPDRLVCFQNQRFRRIKAPGTLRLAALGGSSVNYLQYEFSRLPEQLLPALNGAYNSLETLNCGGLSYGSHRLVLIAREVLQYDLDLLMIYSGHNEFEELQQLRLSGIEQVRVQRIFSRSALYRWIRDFQARRAIGQLEADRQRRELAVSVPDASKAWLHVFTPEEISSRMDAYRNNLETMIKMCRDAGVPVVIGTVPSNLYRPNLPGPEGERFEKEVRPLYEAGKWEEGLNLARRILMEASPRHQSSDHENRIIREVAKKWQVPLADVESAVIAREPHGVPGETLFSDHCHLNEKGNRILMETFLPKMIEALTATPEHAVR